MFGSKIYEIKFHIKYSCPYIYNNKLCRKCYKLTENLYIANCQAALH